jgi:hypothetical protein
MRGSPPARSRAARRNAAIRDPALAAQRARNDVIRGAIESRRLLAARAVGGAVARHDRAVQGLGAPRLVRHRMQAMYELGVEPEFWKARNVYRPVVLVFRALYDAARIGAEA